ncbi:MAG: dihydrolipoyl dehydrogenase [Chitinispirillales bacterium]|jgi:dihydrolipoamide dehydrogenase|nr:dihydrolipoyl dehydrogenase [Chitinispirillales bacterium]
MSTSYDYDLLVIGSGPGGYVAAIRGAQLGLRAAAVERGSVGGVCLNIGCIPTKALIRQAEIYRNKGRLESMGVRIDTSGFRYENVFNASRKAAETLSKGVAYLLKKNKVELITATARLVSEHEVSVSAVDTERTLSARAVIVAAGSRPKSLPGFEFDGKSILSSDDALMMKELPRRALIVGAGAIGAEFAHIMEAFGTDAHIVEMADRVLPASDGEVSALVRRSFMKRGMKVYTASTLSSYRVDNGSVNAVIRGADGAGVDVSVDKIFVMTGRAPNTEGVGLDAVGINTVRGFVETGDYYQTGVKSIYAIGDVVAGAPMLAHAASRQGEIAAEHIAGAPPKSPRVDPAEVPSVVYCEPSVAAFGLTEEQAAMRGAPFVKAAFPFKACGKAVAADESEGFVKILADPSTGGIVGAHIVGAGASELIHELLLARNSGAGVDGIADAIHAHPTLSEAVMESARMIGGRAAHV